MVKAFNEYWPTPEESDVRIALKDYTFNALGATDSDFVPTHILYDIYLEYINTIKKESERVEEVGTLAPNQFGMALHRVFGMGGDHRVQRKYRGRVVRGYIYMEGPKSIISHAYRGRPRKK